MRHSDAARVCIADSAVCGSDTGAVTALTLYSKLYSKYVMYRPILGGETVK